MKSESRSKTRLWQGLLILVAVFVIDLLVPLGVAVGVLYVCSIGLFIRTGKRRILSLSAIASFLIILVPFLTSTPETTWMAYVNRGISLIAIWVMCIIAIQHNIALKMQAYTFQLQQKNKELEQFTSIVSHDLKEPLRTISSFISIIKKKHGKTLPLSVQEHFKYIVESCKRMTAQINGLLNYSRIGQIPNLTLVDCNALTSAVIEDLASQIQETNAQIEIEKLPRLNAYPTELRLLFQNLLSNAIKFHKPKTTPVVKIYSTRKKGRWQFAFADNGIGIKKEDQKNIFEIFHRLHAPTKIEGHGIGLSYCKKIIDMHGGKIWVESEVNKGSTFYFTMPT